MAFGLRRKDLQEWKMKVDRGEIAFLTHYWLDERFPGCKTVTKVGCSDLNKLKDWGKSHGLKSEWIDYRTDGYSHFDLIGARQKEILEKEKLWEHLERLQ
ncbi:MULTISPECIES: hypothetical protein [unclassified Cytobacillus]|uniref:hypothetical protein n=1 Tax=unclassified Cytobacillus TaxID=2675268 RepID=UPI00135ADF53|nr:hypothetical protein [Cytobacillus sp. AMY 15.2]KAF0817422.1 putative protein YneQ [Bacillus sp. ZZV12-4809]MCM3091684.1 hypothetical protein [Cytobacillus sp. AMY 15.2]